MEKNKPSREVGNLFFFFFFPPFTGPVRRDEHLGSKLLSMGIQNSDHHIAQIITFPKIPDMPMAMSTRYVFGEILNLKKQKK